MNLRRFSRIRITASAVLLAFLVTLAASAAPSFHQRLHNVADDGSHVCAVTLLASGSYDHAFAPPAVSEPDETEQAAIVTPRLSLRARDLEYSLLEHAPPALS